LKKFVIEENEVTGKRTRNIRIKLSNKIRQLVDLSHVVSNIPVLIRIHSRLYVTSSALFQPNALLQLLLLPYVLVIRVRLGLELPSLIEKVDHIHEDFVSEIVVELAQVAARGHLNEAPVVPVDHARLVHLFLHHVPAQIVLDPRPQRHWQLAYGRRMEFKDVVENVVIKAEYALDLAL